VFAAAEVLAAGRVVVVEQVLVDANGDQAVVGVAEKRAAVPCAGVADERRFSAADLEQFKDRVNVCVH
jgi:hypothetical protein